MERFEGRSDGGSPSGNSRWHSQGNAPHFDVRTRQYRMTGVDLAFLVGAVYLRFVPEVDRTTNRIGHLGPILITQRP